MIFTSLLCSNDSRVTHIQLSNCRINDTGIVTIGRDESSGVKKEKGGGKLLREERYRHMISDELLISTDPPPSQW